MSLRFPITKTAIDLLAGLVGLFFDQLDGPSPSDAAPALVNDLTKIGGIGPTFARRLNEAEINTYAELASTTPERVREITHVAEWQGNPLDWIAQAKVLAAGEKS